MDLLSLRIYTAYIGYRYNIGKIWKIVATKPTDILSPGMLLDTFIYLGNSG